MINLCKSDVQVDICLKLLLIKLKPTTTTCRCILVYVLFIWGRIDTAGLMVVFGKGNIAVVSTGVISSVTEIRRPLYCYIDPSLPVPFEDGFRFFC